MSIVVTSRHVSLASPAFTVLSSLEFFLFTGSTPNSSNWEAFSRLSSWEI